MVIGISIDKKNPPCKQKTNSVKRAILLLSQHTCKYHLVISNISHLASAKLWNLQYKTPKQINEANSIIPNIIFYSNKLLYLSHKLGMSLKLHSCINHNIYRVYQLLPKSKISWRELCIRANLTVQLKLNLG